MNYDFCHNFIYDYVKYRKVGFLVAIVNLSEQLVNDELLVNGYLNCNCFLKRLEFWFGLYQCLFFTADYWAICSL